jgi:hypothetical protein
LIFPRPGADYVAPGKKKKRLKFGSSSMTTLKNIIERGGYLSLYIYKYILVYTLSKIMTYPKTINLSNVTFFINLALSL